MMRVYAGIGARDTPPGVLQLMGHAAEALALAGWVLRSGHAPGADQAFEAGAGRAAEVYMPWPSFEKSVPLEAGYVMDRPSDAARSLAERFHPAWPTLRQGARALHARNAHIVLGPALNGPVAFVLCWTRGAAGQGGTGQATRIAEANGVPVFDLWRDADRERVARLVNRYLEAQSG